VRPPINSITYIKSRLIKDCRVRTVSALTLWTNVPSKTSNASLREIAY